jgi:hypothetical protein
MKDLIEGLQILEKYTDPERPIVLYYNDIYVDVDNALWDEILPAEHHRLFALGFMESYGLRAYRKTVIS